MVSSRIPALAIVCLPLLAGTAAADSPPLLGRAGDFTLAAPVIEEPSAASAWYLRLDGGSSYIPGGSASLGAVTRSYPGGPGWSLGGGIGYRVLPHWRVDATVDVVNHARLSETLLLGNLYWDIGTFGRWTPYIGAGIGAGQITIDESAPIALAAAGLQRTDWQMAWSLMAGASWALTPSLTVNSGYRYVNFGAPSFELTTRPFDLTLSQVQEHQFRLGLRYAFP
ncbi:MAG: hypothetical protein B7X99_02185 [Rhizobiales bacterium 17-65-6]|nr:MAG: hypothetical protein B7Y70_07610 [Rhizobiales bacterium 35-68-8]OZA01016.1 MAG: hypothetical protein B7X99_02185 [Rhizobiales bacterium 17-65-6]